MSNPFMGGNKKASRAKPAPTIDEHPRPHNDVTLTCQTCGKEVGFSELEQTWVHKDDMYRQSKGKALLLEGPGKDHDPTVEVIDVQGREE